MLSGATPQQSLLATPRAIIEEITHTQTPTPYTHVYEDRARVKVHTRSVQENEQERAHTHNPIPLTLPTIPTSRTVSWAAFSIANRPRTGSSKAPRILSDWASSRTRKRFSNTDDRSFSCLSSAGHAKATSQQHAGKKGRRAVRGKHGLGPSATFRLSVVYHDRVCARTETPLP